MNSLAAFLRLVRFSHTLFALPFALASFFLALEGNDISLPLLGWVVLAMVGMRSAAMSFNRLVDARIDAQNPRTKNREIPAGVISRHTVVGYLVVFSLLFFYACYRINTLAFSLSPVAYAICMGYSLCKRYTAYTHFVLGLALGLSPVGAWVAVRGSIDVVPVLLGIGVMLWTAGFDILYSCMDRDFDIRTGLKSIPAKFGYQTSLQIARWCHVLMLLSWVALLVIEDFHWPMTVALGVVAFLIVLEHILVNPDDLKRMNLVFFKLNVCISCLVLAGSLVEIWFTA